MGKNLVIDGLPRLGNNKGGVLILSYFIIAVLVTLGAAFVLISSNESKLAQRQQKSIQALYVAEAGIERALYDLRQDFLSDLSSPSWSDGDINGMALGPDSSNFYSAGYGSATINGGSYAVSFKNGADGRGIYVRSIGTVENISQTIEIYAKIQSLSPWDNAIFAGAGASGAMVNGNVNIRGSVHILGSGLDSTDYAIDLGGTAELVGNNYNGLDSALLAKVPALETTVFNGETVQTLNAELRVKRGIVGLSGSSSVGEANATGNAVKETVNGSFVSDGFGGTQGTGSVPPLRMVYLYHKR